MCRKINFLHVRKGCTVKCVNSKGTLRSCEKECMEKGSAPAQVLWHTAAAFSERLVATAGLPAEELAEQASQLAADRRQRQQAPPAVPAVEEAAEGERLSTAP